MRRNRGAKGTLIYLSVIGLILITFVAFLDDIYFLINGNPTSNLTDKKDEETKKEAEVIWSGVYQTDDGKILKIYKADDNNLIVTTNKETSNEKVTYKINSENLKQISSSNNTQKITYQNNVITVENKDGLIYAGKYNKQQEYTMINYFNDNFGDDKVILFSKWNGIYSNDNYTFKMYQIGDSLKIKIETDTNEYITCNIEEEKAICQTETGNFDLIVNENNVSITGIYKSQAITGNYNKGSAYSMEDIVLDDMKKG
ncbi:MAG: hypothetical protein PHU05_03045 [Bacilli bacterium]|nr:hypothetical protein [Bacilli bacterium]